MRKTLAGLEVWRSDAAANKQLGVQLAMTAVLSFVLGVSASAQTLGVGSSYEDYIRALQISGRSDVGSFTVRGFGLQNDLGSIVIDGDHPWRTELNAAAHDDEDWDFSSLDPELSIFSNSRFPTGQNDGAVWQGKGLTTALDFGGEARWRNLSVMVRPVITHAQNSSFELAPAANEFAYPWSGGIYPYSIDLPQRFGSDSFWEFDPGQSEIRLDLGGASFGGSTSALWWGPGIRNALVMSNNAPGIPNLFLGTNEPLDIAVGELEARWIWGNLDQSDWFDPSVANTDRFLTGIVATYSPDFFEGLSLGMTRVFYGWVPDGGSPFGDYFAVFQGLRKKGLATEENPHGNDEHDQLLSLFSRWVLTESGLEIYAEWARNDHAWDLRDFLLEPEHSRAFTFGLQKAVDVGSNRILSLKGEVTSLERGSTLQVRAVPVYYMHHRVAQGYTQRGQIIGAGIGPGGSVQFIGGDLYTSWGLVGTYFERQVHDNDAYYQWARANDAGFWRHDVSFRWGAHGLLFVGDFDVSSGLVVTREFNRYFSGPDLWNLNLRFSARWRPR